jgi:cytochrome c556
MPRTTQDIIDQADKLAKQFEDHEPDASNIRDASALHRVREAFQRRAASEQKLAEAVNAARKDGQSWAAIGAMLGTSGEAARQRYASPAVKH